MPHVRSNAVRRGNAFLEFALVFLVLLTMIVGMFEFAWALFLRATFHHAVREGARFAITGNAGSSGLDDSIKQVIERNTFGLLSGSKLDEHVSVEFFDPTCPNGATCPLAAAEPGAIVRVGINCYSLVPITNLVRKDEQGDPLPITLTVTASDKMEPFPGGPAPRGATADPTACD